MTTATTIHTSTSHQRLYIRTLLRDLELPTDNVTVMHRDLFKRGGIAWQDGADLDTCLRAVSKTAASNLIKTLKERIE